MGQPGLPLLSRLGVIQNWKLQDFNSQKNDTTYQQYLRFCSIFMSALTIAGTPILWHSVKNFYGKAYSDFIYLTGITASFGYTPALYNWWHDEETKYIWGTYPCATNMIWTSDVDYITNSNWLFIRFNTFSSHQSSPQILKVKAKCAGLPNLASRNQDVIDFGQVEKIIVEKKWSFDDMISKEKLHKKDYSPELKFYAHMIKHGHDISKFKYTPVTD